MITMAQSPVEFESFSSVERQTVVEMCSAVKLDQDSPTKMELGQRHFAFGEYFLTLERNPTLLADLRNNSFEVVGWNIQLPFQKAGEINREIIRKFLFLLGKAERKELNEQEDAEWAEIVKQVDYRKFSIETAPPVYVEGKLLGKTPDGFEVEWHDGSKESVASPIGDSLGLLNVGEWFKAFGKFGDQNKLVALVQLVPIPPLDSGNGDELWKSWPSNRS